MGKKETVAGADFNADITAALQVMGNGGIILYPTDTIWGIGCDASNEGAIRKIYALKKRAEKKSMIILVSGQDMINRYVSDPSPLLVSALAAARVPTTAIFEHAAGLPGPLVHEDGTIAVRMVSDEFCRRLIGGLDQPLVSTSANVSGQVSPRHFREIGQEIKNGVDYIVSYRQQEEGTGTASAIIRLNAQGAIERIR